MKLEGHADLIGMAFFTTDDIPDQTGRLAIITGATGGLGLETALALAWKGAEVILAARNPTKGREAEALIRAAVPKARVGFEPLNLASLASVEAFAARTREAGRPINILINNAGVMALPTRQLTVDGFEMQFATNYLSHFALTGRLLPLLTAGQARVVQLSSIAHKGGRIRLEDLNHERCYRPWPVYQQSKLAMLMFAIELQRRSDAGCWGLTSVAAHPGFAHTDLMANGPASGGGGLHGWGIGLLERLAGHSAAAGALPTLVAATARDVTPAAYYGPQGWQDLRGPPGLATIRPRALDRAVASALWATSETLTDVYWRL